MRATGPRVVAWFAAFLLLALGTACSRDAPSRDRAAAAPPILLFAGAGTSANDVKAFETVLISSRLGYARVDSRLLNEGRERQLQSSRLLIVPGGNFEEIGNALTPAASAAIRRAVQNGLNYLGVCAGAFVAGDSPYNGINLTSGVRFGFYALEDRGVRKAAVAVSAPESPTIDHYWEDGPQLSGWGDVVAKYPDGTPAVVQGAVGKGWVILAGIHPEAPESWRHGMSFRSPPRVANAYAATLVRAALDGIRLPQY